MADTAVEEQVNSNHKIEVDERPTLKVIEPITQEQAEQEDNQAIQEAKERQSYKIGRSNE